MVYPPTRILNTALLGHDAARLHEAVSARQDKPLVVVVPRHDGPTPTQTADLLKEAKLWLLD